MRIGMTIGPIAVRNEDFPAAKLRRFLKYVFMANANDCMIKVKPTARMKGKV